MQVSYADYMAQKNNRNNTNNNFNSNNQTKVTFLNTLLRNDNDVVIVRFPYKDLSDIKLDKCHSVQFPGDQWSKQVRCTGDANCPLCAEGKKTSTRFFAKMLVYLTQPDGSIQIVPAVWDRPSTFVDVELAEKFRELEEDEMGPLCDNLIKIRRCGAAGSKDTRYSLTIAHNKSIYNSDNYKADFSILEDIDPSRILSKDITKYLEAFHIESSKTDVENNIPTETPNSVPDANPSDSKANEELPFSVTSKSTYETPRYTQPNYNQPVETNNGARADSYKEIPIPQTSPTYERRTPSFGNGTQETNRNSDSDRIRPRRTYDF